MYHALVVYQFPDMTHDAEKEFVHLHDALKFADSVIESGGWADAHAEEVIGHLPPHLCEVYMLERDPNPSWA